MYENPTQGVHVRVCVLSHPQVYRFKKEKKQGLVKEQELSEQSIYIGQNFRMSG